MTIDIASCTTSGGIDLCGDIFFKIINSKTKKLICRFAINTSFIDKSTNTYKLSKASVDPDSVLKNKDFDNDFGISVNFKNVCDRCNP